MGEMDSMGSGCWFREATSAGSQARMLSGSSTTFKPVLVKDKTACPAFLFTSDPHSSIRVRFKNPPNGPV